MELIFERSRPGRGSDILPPLDVPAAGIPAEFARKRDPACLRSERAICPGTTRPWPAGPSGCATGSTPWAPAP